MNDRKALRRTLGLVLQLTGMALMPVALLYGLLAPRGFLLEIGFGVTGILSFLSGRFLESRNQDPGPASPAAPAKPRDEQE